MESAITPANNIVKLLFFIYDSSYHLINILPAACSFSCLLYTSDAADDLIGVDLGGRRIIKKIFFKQKTAYEIRLSLVGSEMCIRDRE